MNSGEKWSMISYSGTAGSQDKTVINPIMLRFRPIAPKPVAGESGSGGGQFDNRNLLLFKPRAKRKYVRVRKNNIKRKKRSSSEHLHHDEASKNPENIVTLQLLPEKTEANGSINLQNGAVFEENLDPLSLFNLNFKNRRLDRVGAVEEPDRRMVMSQRRRVTVVESWVTVECVTDSCMEVRELGSTDVERMKNLEADTCPGFISDGLNRVQWVNGAYKRMLMVREGKEEGPLSVSAPETMVWLVVKQELPRFCSAFSCTVRLQYTRQKEKYSRMLPCDAWKMGGGGGGGGFAWRLDVEAALSLGR